MHSIVFKNNTFYLSGKNTSYIFSILPTGHLRHIHYGAIIRPKSVGIDTMTEENDMWSSWNAVYDFNHPLLAMSNTMLEYSLPGKGDNRTPSAIIRYDEGSYVLDMIYETHKITKELPLYNIPSPIDSSSSETLIVQLKDKAKDIRIKLYYTIYPEEDVIVRSTEVINNTDSRIHIEKLSSIVLDTEDDSWDAITLDGSWGHEKTMHRAKLIQGTRKIESRTGFSSNEHDPLVVLLRKDTDQFKGEAIATTLMYSGNHAEIIEKTPFRRIRIDSGINSENFSWPLETNERFRTPNAILTWCDNGLEGLSRKLSSFASRYVIGSKWKNTPRPILINNWEATYYDYDETKIHALIDKAYALGFELFVLDDGWFGKRNSNKTSLGDWYCNSDKLPSGIKALSSYVHNKGMMFGLWFEPEMINLDSELYREHPEWIVSCPNREPSPAKNEFILDLTRKDVRDHIITTLSGVVKDGIDYIKWDMNRDMSDMYSPTLPDQGMFFHSYIFGLYDILERFTQKFPDILIEMCANGGDRIDWGIMKYSPQAWISDVSDASERISLQQSTMLSYPRSFIGAHVSASPNHQTLREIDIETRFDVATMGILGYELDITQLNPIDENKIQQQIAFYKEYRDLFQYGEYHTINTNDENTTAWAIGNDDCYIVVTYQYKNIAASGRHELLKLPFIDIDKNWIVTERVSSDETPWKVEVSGEILSHHGIYLPAKFTGRITTGRVRKLKDNSSSMFIIKAK